MHSKASGLWARLLLAAFSAALSLTILAVIGEWAVRRRERTRTTAPGTMSMIFYRHSRLMHGLVRGMDYYGWVHMGRQGFRGARDVSQTPPDSVFRIITVGGSTTFDGNTSGDSSTWSARLEQILDSVAAPRQFEVLNAGVPGFQVFDDLVRLQLELHAFKPHLVVLYQGHNDLYNTLSSAGRPSAIPYMARPYEQPAVTPWKRWLEQNSLLYHKLSQKWQATTFRRRGTQQGARVAAVDLDGAMQRGSERFARNVGLFLAAARELGIPVVVPQIVYTAESAPGSGRDSSVTRLWRVAVPFAPPDAVLSGYVRFDSVAKAVASKYGAAYVPAADSSLWRADAYTTGDAIHFNDQGAWRFAQNLAGPIRAIATGQAHSLARP